MTVFDLYNQRKQLSDPEVATLKTVLALGAFDGVHKGHAALLKKAHSLARQYTTPTCPVFPAVWTFSDSPDKKAPALTTLSDKLALFQSHGIRYVFLASFAVVKDIPAETFASDILLRRCGARAAVCGFNFRFGHGAEGDPALLSAVFEKAHATVSVIDAVVLWDSPISSTRIRGLLSDGDVKSAADCLGRNFSLCLPVVHGKELGRTIGVPTINQNIPVSQHTPAHGTYATAVSVDGILYPSVTNVGIRPSIEENDSHIPNAETHIIGYRGWLYDKSVRVYFRYRLRPETRFPSITALKEQIARDIAASSATFDASAKEICHV